MSKDYYDILGVDKNTSKEEIKKAYGILVHQYHPDKENGSEKRFKDLNEAYRILYSDDSRREYDRTYSYNSTTEKKEKEQQYENKKEKHVDIKNEKVEIKENDRALYYVLIISFILIILISLLIISVTNSPQQNLPESTSLRGYRPDDFSDIESILNESPSEVISDTYTDIQLGSNLLNQNGFEFSLEAINMGSYMNDYTWGLYKKYSEGTFSVLSLKINNTTSTNGFTKIKSFKLIDQAGREYFPLKIKDCEGAWIENYTDNNYIFLKPDIPCTVKLLFEVSKNTDKWHLNFKINKTNP